MIGCMRVRIRDCRCCCCFTVGGGMTGGSWTYTPCATTHRNEPYTQHTHMYTMHTHYREEAEAEVEEPPEEVDTEGIMMRMLRILKPGESVLKVG